MNSLSDPKQLYAIFTLDDPKKLRMEVERIYLRMRSVLEKKMGIYLTIGSAGAAASWRERKLQRRDRL